MGFPTTSILERVSSVFHHDHEFPYMTVYENKRFECLVIYSQLRA
jgi:hypothetical protein